MSYHMNGKLVGIGATALGDDEVKNIAKKCAQNLEGFGGSKAEREKAFKSTAECAADAACAYFSGGAVPPGICSSIAGPIAGFAISVWNSVFGNEEEWEAYYAARAASAAFFVSLNQAYELDGMMGAAITAAVARTIEAYDKMVPARAGQMGSGRHEQPGKTPPVWYANYQPAAKALEKAGAAIRPHPHDVDPQNPAWIPADNIGQTYMEIDDTKGHAASQKWLGTQGVQIAKLFLSGLQKAEEKVFLDILGEAAALAAAEGNTQVLLDGAKKARSRRMSQGIMFAGLGAVAGVGVFMWRKRR